MIIDTNVHLGRWPFRRLRGDGSAAELAELLRAKGVTQAWAGGFEGVFHLDVAGANARLAEACRGGFFLPFGTVNPALPDWEEDLRRCHDVHRMPGIRLYPGYHDYALDDPRLAALLRAAAERKLLVQVALKLEDVRVQHRLARVPAADPALLPDVDGLRLMLLNAPADRRFAVDISAVEGAAALAALPAERLLFGSHAPFLTWDAAALKVKEAGLDEGRRTSILSSNARRLLAP